MILLFLNAFTRFPDVAFVMPFLRAAQSYNFLMKYYALWLNIIKQWLL